MNIKILIHGRKNGYTVLYPKPTPIEFYSFASDIQSISANNYDIYHGKEFYTLAISDSGCIYTKYIFGDDGERGQLGEIGISVYIPTNFISGVKIKNLLDELIETFRSEYMPFNKIQEPKNGFNWPLFTSIADNYELIENRHTFFYNIKSGNTPPAFHYYKSENELINLFDKPFQEEYTPYKQIYFIDCNFQGNANPLNVLKNSGNEVNPDLENEYFFLSNYDRNKNVKIEAYFNNDWHERTDKLGENLIRAKWPVKIIYSKEYYKPIEAPGSISNYNTDIHKYLEKTGNNIEIKYTEFQPTPEEKTLTFEVLTKKENVKVEDAEIQIDDYEGWQKISKYTFKAEKLGREFKISARKGENLRSDVVKIRPSDYTLTLHLIEKRVVKIVVTEDEDEKDNIPDFKVWISNGKCNTQKLSEVTFTGDEIDKTWDITVEKDGYSRSIPLRYNPKDGDKTIYFKLKKVPKRTTSHKTSQTEHFFDKREGKTNTFASKAKVFFSTPAIIAGFLVSVLVMTAAIWTLLYFHQKQTTPNVSSITAKQIKNYVEGDAFILDTLNYYKKEWEKQKPNIESSAGITWYNPTTWFVGSNTITPDSSQYNEWEKTFNSLEKAIEARRLLDSKKFSELKKQKFFSDKHSIKSCINNIDSTKYTVLSNSNGLNDISTLTLTQIADSINAIIEKTQTQNLNNNNVQTKQNSAIKNSENKTDKAKYQKLENEFENEFWEIVHKNESISQKKFDDWFERGDEISYDNAFKDFYNNHLKTKGEFTKLNGFFKKPASERKRVKTLDDLKKEIQ